MATEPNARRSDPCVSLPPAVYQKMAHCFYGDGPRYWQANELDGVDEPRMIAKDGFGHQGLSPHLTADQVGNPRGMFVPPIPRNWVRKGTDVDQETDGGNDVQVSD